MAYEEYSLTTDGARVNNNEQQTAAPSSTTKKLLTKLLGPSSLRRGQLNSVLMFIVAWLVMAVTFILVYKEKVNFTFGYLQEHVISLEDRFRFTLRFQILPATWLMHSIAHLAFKRFRTVAYDPLSDHEEVVQLDKNQLQNTVEQTIFSLIVQYMLAVILTPALVLKVIPVMNIFFFFGRITYWLGYPKYRLFGFLFSMLPSAVAVKYIWFDLLGFNKSFQ